MIHQSRALKKDVGPGSIYRDAFKIKILLSSQIELQAVLKLVIRKALSREASLWMTVDGCDFLPWVSNLAPVTQICCK